MSYRIINGRVYHTGLNNNFHNGYNSNVSEGSSTKFKSILDEKLKNHGNIGFKVSNHASERLKSINLNSIDYKKIEEGFKKAREKGSKNAVILYKNMALVASIENSTLITVVADGRAKENVFTNIDSLVIL
ncbi:TIGR02530 family flagellar biosynthesis protein [Clostridium sp.]|uniref:TIGR02530 family flagellar biosynthesis protein n=1 Tax=Clostridium sp. TaxID=1506 RepID=UPI003995CF84